MLVNGVGRSLAGTANAGLIKVTLISIAWINPCSASLHASTTNRSIEKLFLFTIYGRYKQLLLLTLLMFLHHILFSGQIMLPETFPMLQRRETLDQKTDFITCIQ